MKPAPAFLFCAAVAALGQTAFEAASIKPNNSGSAGYGLNVQPARIKVINAPLKFCVQAAWNVKDFQVSGGAPWTGSDRFDIDAVAANSFEDNNYRAMLQTLLADRFGLVVHTETHEKPGYALVAAKGGPKLPPPIDDQSRVFSRTPSGDIVFTATSATLDQLAQSLSTRLGLAIVDRTGIDGKYNVSLQWTPDPASEPRLSKSGVPLPPPPADAAPGPTIFTAIQEKLGLKLESRKVPVQVIVIDSAHRPTEN